MIKIEFNQNNGKMTMNDISKESDFTELLELLAIIWEICIETTNGRLCDEELYEMVLDVTHKFDLEGLRKEVSDSKLTSKIHRAENYIKRNTGVDSTGNAILYLNAKEISKLLKILAIRESHD